MSTRHDPRSAGAERSGGDELNGTTGGRQPERPPRLSRRLDFCVGGTSVIEYIAGRERVAHPCPGARPGETIAVGPGHRYIAYQADGMMVAALYIHGRLLRRDLAGWWTAGPRGQRHPVPDLTVADLLGTVPDEWPILDEQAPLLGTELLGGAS